MNERMVEGAVPPLALLLFGIGAILAGFADGVERVGGMICALMGIASVIMAGFVYYDN